MKKIIPNAYRFAIAGLLMLSGAVMAADPVPVYYLINGGSADSDIKILNLSSSATANSILVDDGTNSSSISVNAGAIGTIVDSASGMNPGATISGSSGKPFIAMGTGNGTGMPLFTPGFAGQTFIIPHYSGDHRYYLYNPTGSAISVTVTLNGTPDTFNLASGLTEYDAGTTNTISGIVEAASDIYVAHREDGGTSWAYAVPPAAQSVLGVKSGSVLLGASEDDTSVTVYTSGNATATIDLDAGERVVVSTGTGATQNNGDALRLVSNNASKPIAAIQVDDGDGSQATAFWSENLLSLHSGVAVDTQYIAVVCRYPAVIKLHDGATTTTKTCQANGNYPGKEYFGSTTNGTSINAGARLESSSPLYFVAENSANNDESSLWSYEPDTIIVNTTTASSITANTTWHTGNVYQIGSDLTVNTGVTLTIEPGVIVIATGAQNDIIVEGTLAVQGTAVAPVIFTTEEATDAASLWQGIWVKSGGTATFDYAEIERADTGIDFDNTGSAGSVTNADLHHNSKGIRLYKNAYPTISYSSIHDNTNGIYIEPTTTPTNNPSASIHHNTINANTNGINIVSPSNTSAADAKPVIQYNDLSGNTTKAILISGSYTPSGMSVTTLNANYNWWGSTVVTQIDAAITDEMDTSTIDAVVDFNHYATSSAVNAFSANQVLVGNHYSETITLAANAQHVQLGVYTLGAGSTMTVGEGSTYTINDINSDFIIEAGATLTINKHSTITAHSTSTANTSSIEVYGMFEVDGDDLNRVIFNTDMPTLDEALNYWDGIHVRAGGEAYLEYVNIEQSDGLHFYDGTYGTIGNSSIQYNKYGVYVEGDADILSIGNQYAYNQYGVYVVGGSTGTGEHMPQPVFVWDLISANTAYGVYVTSSGNANDARPSVNASLIVDNGGTNIERDYYVAGTWADPLQVLYAAQCYWGVDNYTLVSETLVYDHMDNAALPYVDFGKIFIDVTSSQLEQLTGETLIGSIGAITTLDANTTYTLISSLDITSTLNLGDGTVLIVPDGFNINVASGGTLYMGAGSRIEFEDAASKINVTGTLTIDGTSILPVVLTNDGIGQWYGIVVNSGGTVDIDYANISYAQYGVYFSDGSSGIVAHSNLTANTKGIYIIGNSDPEISYSTITSSTDGFYIAGSSSANGAPEPYIHHNTISGNTTGIYLDPVFVANKEPNPNITYNTIINNVDYSLEASGSFANASSHVINATNNWWGTTDIAQIHIQIYDRQRASFSAASNHSPTVNFGSYALSSALSSFKANTLVGPIVSNTTLTADTTYTVIGHVSVAQGVTLTIPDNVQLQIAALYSQITPPPLATHTKVPIEFEVNGYLEINGDDSNTTSAVEYTRFTSLAATPAVADWEGIIVNEGGRLWMDHGEVVYANNGIYLMDGTDARSQIWASLIHDHQNAAIKMQGGLTPHAEAPEDGIWLMGNVLYNANYGVYIDIASADTYSPPKSKMVYNWIKNMNQWGVWIGSDNGSTSSRNPVIVINANGFENNGSQGKSNLFLETGTWPSAGTLDAQSNLWAYFDPEVISTTISDRVDATVGNQARTPLVDFRNYTIEWVDENTLTSQANDILGPITEDTTLSVANGDTHVTLIGDVVIPEGVVLTIEEGVQVFVSGAYTMQVDGVLVVNGTAANPVVFSSDDLNPAVNDWQGIVVSSTGAAQIVNAVIQNANKAITFDSIAATVTLNSVTYTNKVDDSIIQNNNYGIWCINTPSSLPITDNLIQFNSQYGLYFEGSAGGQVTGNLITNNGTGVYLLGNSSNSSLNPTPTINNNSIFDNTSYEVRIHNYHSSVTVDLQSNWWEHTPTVGTSGTYDVYVSGTSGTGNANVANHLTTDPAIVGAANDLTLNRDYISPNNDSVQDTVSITGTLQLSASWTVKIRNYAGTIVKTYTGSGTSVSATWDGKDSQSTPAVVPDGLYRVELWTSTRYLTSDAVIVDTTAPVARIDDINNQTWTTIATKTIVGRASDDHFNDYTLDYQRSGTSTWTALTGQSNVSVYDNVIGTWVLGSDTVAPPTNGTYTVRLVVSDDAGNSTTSTVTVTLDLVAITNVTQNYKTVDLSVNNFVVTYDLSVDADWVKMQIYPEQGGSLVKEIEVNTVTAGAGKTITWDGKNTAGNYVPREAYEFILIADAANSTSQYTYDPPKPSTANCSFTETGNTTDDRNFNAYTNDVWKQEITVSSTNCVNGGRIWLIATPANTLYAKTNILNMAPYSPGVYDITWDGIDANGLRVQGSVSFYYSQVPPLPMSPNAFDFAKNVVIIDPAKLAPVVKGGTLTAPTVEIKSDPYLVYHSYDQFLHIDYNLDKASYVVIKLLPPGVTSFSDPSAITVYDSGTCGLCSITGNQALNWYGHNSTDTNNILVSDEGVYTYAIEATAVAGSVKNTVKGVVNLLR